MHAHSHDHVHAHHHGPAHRHAVPVRQPFSAMLMSAPLRLGVAGGLVAVLWALVLWAMR